MDVNERTVELPLLRSDMHERVRPLSAVHETVHFNGTRCYAAPRRRESASQLSGLIMRVAQISRLLVHLVARHILPDGHQHVSDVLAGIPADAQDTT